MLPPCSLYGFASLKDELRVRVEEAGADQAAQHRTRGQQFGVRESVTTVFPPDKFPLYIAPTAWTDELAVKGLQLLHLGVELVLKTFYGFARDLGIEFDYRHTARVEQRVQE